jgi:hypothetical protein
MRGYKIIDRDLTARGIAYTPDVTKQHSGDLGLGTSGLHFCPRAVNCLRYEYRTGMRYFEVEAVGTVVVRGGNACTDELRLTRELTEDEFRSLCTDSIREYHPGGAIKSEMSYTLGRRDGVAVEWHEDGRVRSKETWREGHMHGRRVSWYPTGTLESITNWENDWCHGMCRTWTEAGEPLSITKWHAGTMVAFQRCSPEGLVPRPVSPTLQIAAMFPLPDD